MWKKWFGESSAGIESAGVCDKTDTMSSGGRYGNGLNEKRGRKGRGCCFSATSTRPVSINSRRAKGVPCSIDKYNAIKSTIGPPGSELLRSELKNCFEL